MVLPWLLLLLVTSAAAVRCPDGTKCGEETLCCELPDGHGYGCCPENEIVSPSLPMITSGVSCSNDEGCPEEYSCVGTPQGTSACCPFAQGTSCQDGHHCCPSGSHCSEDGHCVPASKLSAIICPDGSSECPNDATCCQMADQSWGCCPIIQATCCNDHLHCCPHSSMCDLEHGKCVSENGEVPLFKKVPARVKLVSAETLLDLAEKVKEVNCSDGSSCPDGTTCCRTVDKHYGCCPFLSAVCCGDMVHCCPSGTTCDVPQKKCVNANFEIPMYSKVPALREEATVRCDDTAVCPGTQTCCRLASGEWGCCPYPRAICCDDHEHCCPAGFNCVKGECQQQALSIPWSEKMPAIKQRSADVQCNESTSCHDKSTCCRLQSGEWGCCPFEQAVCCSDHLHCCPSGYTCDLASATCNKPSGALKITPIQPVGYVWCDSTHACYDGQTCCVGLGGIWTCCPYPHGVCCPDRVHCCPYGHVCLNAGAQCSRSGSLRWDLLLEGLKPRL